MSCGKSYFLKFEKEKSLYNGRKFKSFGINNFAKKL